jgi:hypothetical protein
MGGPVLFRHARRALAAVVVAVTLSALPSGVAVAAPAPVSPNELFVRAAYQDILGREGDSQGVEYWTGLLNTGKVTRKQVAKQMLRSPEATKPKVEQVYRDALGREADAAGLAYWVKALGAGLSSVRFVALQYGSDEAYRQAGGTDEAWVTWLCGVASIPCNTGSLLHERVMAMSKQFGRVGFAETVYRSPGLSPLPAKRVQAIYWEILKRPGDESGVAYYAEILRASSEEEVIALLASSTEYFLQAQTR